MEIDRKGQAAITDALYFLLIVTALCVFLFSFANNYGVSASSLIVRQYNADYSTSALKTILYSSTPRDPVDSLYDDDVEIDHLLAYIKEDYADDEKLEKETAEVLAKNIKSIMSPKADSHDYIFSISIPNEDKFVFVFFHFSNFVDKAQSGARWPIYGPGDPSHFDVFCGIKKPPATENSITRDTIANLIAKVGDTSQSSAKIKLVKEEKGHFEDFKAQADLIMWNAINTMPSGATITMEQFYKSDREGWCCIEVGKEFSTSAC